MQCSEWDVANGSLPANFRLIGVSKTIEIGARDIGECCAASAMQRVQCSECDGCECSVVNEVLRVRCVSSARAISKALRLVRLCIDVRASRMLSAAETLHVAKGRELQNFGAWRRSRVWRKLLLTKEVH